MGDSLVKGRNQEPCGLFTSMRHEAQSVGYLKEAMSSFECLRMEIHMKRAFILAAGLTLLATGAWSQDSSRDRDDFGRGWRESRDSWNRDMDRRRGPMMRHDDDQDDRSERGARFFLRSGDAQLRIVCGNRESTQSCVDAALRLFDRVQSQQGTTTRAPTTPSPSQSPQ